MVASSWYIVLLLLQSAGEVNKYVWNKLLITAPFCIYLAFYDKIGFTSTQMSLFCGIQFPQPPLLIRSNEKNQIEMEFPLNRRKNKIGKKRKEKQMTNL